MRKIEPLSGFLRSEHIRCGKPACRCARGGLHGPYWYRRWRENGRQRRAYVKPADLGQTLGAIAAWRKLHPPAYAVRQQLAELRRLLGALDRLEV